MQYYTRLEESPSLVTLAMLKVNPRTKVTVSPMEDRYGRSVAVRAVVASRSDEADSVYVCAGDNPVFVANVIVFAHAHNITLDIKESHIWCDGA
jgi:hypothetical protein